MTWNPEVSSINQRVQVGAESTSALGTAVAAGKTLQCFTFDFGIGADVKTFGATGHKYDQIAIENYEWTDGTVGGAMDFNGLIYPLSGVFGSVAPASHGTSSTAKDWIFNPPTTGSIVPQTYTFQQGDSIRAHQLAYGLFTDFGYKLTRKDASVSGKLIAQQLSDGITMTASPTAVALAPIVGNMWNVYLDSTSSGLGTTQLLRVLSVDYSIAGVYGPFYALNRSTPSFSAHVDLKPKTEVKLMVEADANGMALLSYLRAGTTYYLRVQAQGTEIDVPNTVYNTFQHDMAIKVSKTNPFKDDSGIFAIEWDLTVVEDATWGKAQTATVTNLITAL